MNKYLIILLIIASFCAMLSCEKKDQLEEPVACFTAQTDTIKKNEYVTFYLCGDAMHNVIFTGDFLSVFNGIDSINGQGYPVQSDSVELKYIKTGEFQPWLLSTNANYTGTKRVAIPLNHTIVVIE